MKYNPLKIIPDRTKVRILNPVFVLRVGYENNFRDTRVEVLNTLKRSLWKSGEQTDLMKAINEFNKIMRSLVKAEDFREEGFPFVIKDDEEWGPNYQHSRYEVDREKLLEKVASVMAYQIVGLRMDNANQERKLFTKEVPEFLHDIRTVRAVTHNKIGRRFASRSWQGYDDGDYEPGGLEGEKTVTIVHFDPCGFSTGKLTAVSSRGAYQSIEAKNVEVYIEILNQYKEFADWFEKNPTKLSLRQQLDAVESIDSYCPTEEEKIAKEIAYERCMKIFIKNLEEASWDSPFFEELRKKRYHDDKEISTKAHLIERHSRYFSNKLAKMLWTTLDDEQRFHLLSHVTWESEFLFDHFDILFSEEEKDKIRKEVYEGREKVKIKGDKSILLSHFDVEAYIAERAW